MGNFTHDFRYGVTLGWEIDQHWTREESLRLARFLKVRFPELGTDEEMNGGDVVEALCELYEAIKE